MNERITPSRLLGVALMLLLLGGCGGEYVVASLSVEHDGWDTLRVAVAFGQRQTFGVAAAAPESLAVFVFDAAFDTLYAGDGRQIILDDKTLGDRERLLVEACGTFAEATVCEQHPTTASPKRLRLDPAIAYPEEPTFEHGSYELRFVVERQRPDTSGWEVLDDDDGIEGYLLAFVGEATEKGVRVPVAPGNGRFDLARYPRFQEFRYQLKSTLLDAEEAAVRFEVYAGLRGQPPVRLASVEKRVLRKTEEERRLEVRHFAQQAGRWLLDRLDVEEHDREAFAYVEDWDFNPITATYRIEMAVEWRHGGRFFGRDYALRGMLDIKEDGSEARFSRRSANGAAARRWHTEVEGGTLTLPPLEIFNHEAEAAAEVEVED